LSFPGLTGESRKHDVRDVRPQILWRLDYYSETPIPSAKRSGIGKLNYPAQRRVEDPWARIHINIVGVHNKMDRPLYTTFAWAYDLLIGGPVSNRVAFIAEQLHRRGILPEMHLLDAGCGTGIYSIALAQKGFLVTGLDASDDLIAESKRKAGETTNRTLFLVGDILNLESSLEVDAILCRGVLNDLIEDESRRAVFPSLSRCLRQGGVLVLDVREWHSTVARKTNEPVFEKTVETERGRLTFRSVTEMQPEKQCLLVSETHMLESRSGRQTAAYDFVMRCWTQDEVTERLKEAGFELIQYFGDYDSAKASGTTDRLVAVATRGK
jgi:SAM-dependent methyltransferase